MHEKIRLAIWTFSGSTLKSLENALENDVTRLSDGKTSDKQTRNP